jgi:hypothetical protein
MTVGPGGKIYFITKAKKIYMDAFPAPVQLPGEAIDIAANSSDELFIVSNTPLNADGNMIMKWNGSSWDQFTLQGAKKIAIGPGPGAKPVVIANNGVVWWYNSGIGWGSDGITANEIAICNSKLDVTGNNIVFILRNVVVNSAGDYLIQRYTGLDWYSLLGGAVSITVDGDGHPWLTNKGGLIYRNLQF